MAATVTAPLTGPADPAQSPSPAAKRRPGRPPKNPSLAAPDSPVSPLEAASMYEREREARIRDNLARMQKLGILDLAHTLNSPSPAAGSGRWRKRRHLEQPGSVVAAQTAARIPSSPARRSLRLKNAEPVSYSELPKKGENGSKGVKSEFIEAGSKEEVYTEDHEKLLGTCQTAWTLFVDGYDKDGKRIYDQVRGKTCHQCRQKTLGHHTSCSKCQIVQGQFCGDCLYMRYGENVLEAKKNPNWICPVCRGICNCSICRTKRGWFPTGTAYRKVVSLGYKSVAHYLIATKRSSPNSDNSNPADSSDKLASSKSETSCISDHDAPAAKKSLEEDGETSSKAKTHLQVENSDGYNKDNGSSEPVVAASDPQEDDRTNKDAGCATPSTPTASKKRKVVERNPDCVASRLRSRANKP